MVLEDYFINKTRKTPEVKFNYDSSNSVLRLKGPSIPEDTENFYKPLLNYIEEYCKIPSNKTIIEIDLDYFNHGSTKIFLKIFEKFKDLYKSSKKVQINWYYNEGDDEMMESGESFKSITKIPFRMIEKIN